MKTLRPYQLDAIQQLRDSIAAGARRLLLQAQTGAGKSVIVAHMVKAAYDKGKRASLWVHSRLLVNQLSEELTDAGVPHAVIMAGVERNLEHQVTVCSKDTLVARALRTRRLHLPPSDLIIIDEAHRSTGPSYQKLLAQYPRDKVVVIGPTATPAKVNGRSLGDFYDGLVQVSQPSRLIADGFLVPTKVYAPHRPNLKGLKRKGADYDQEACAALMDKPKLVGSVVLHWQRLAENRPTVVFACNVRHSMHLQNEFAAAGISAEHIDADTPPEEREAAFKRVENGDTKVLVNCMVLTEGWNLPKVACAILACPTRSFVKYRQCAGRIQRPYPGKDYAILIDHSGAVYAFGLPDDDLDWNLVKGDCSVNKLAMDRAKNDVLRKPIKCPSCMLVYSGSPQCPNCGHKSVKAARGVNHEHGHLVAVNETPVPQAEDRKRFWFTCLAVTANRGSTLGSAAAMFSRKFGVQPWAVPGLSPMPEQGEWKARTVDKYPGFVRRKGAR